MSPETYPTQPSQQICATDIACLGRTGSRAPARPSIQVSLARHSTMARKAARKAAKKATKKAVKKSVKKSTKKRKAKKAKKTKKRRKAKRVSKVAKGKRAKSSVFRGTKAKTQGGLTKDKLMKNKRGKVVSKKSHARAVKGYGRISGWTAACVKARKALGIKGFCAIGGKTAKGKAFHAKAKSFYKKK